MSDFKVLTFDGGGDRPEVEVKSAKLAAFLAALPLAGDEDFVVVPSLGTWRAKHVRRGLERRVLVVGWHGMGIVISQPSTHGICQHCASGRKGATCEHCACAMCTWFHISDERASPRVSQAKMLALAGRLKAFQMGAPAEASSSLLDL